jgi:hypothetical protein
MPVWQSLADPNTRFRIFKCAVYGLLAFNLYLLIRIDLNAEVLDQIGWLILLGVFEWESTTLHRDYRPREKLALGAAQAVGYVTVIVGWIGYWLTSQWPEFVNATLWLCVVVLLFADVHWPAHFRSPAWRLRSLLKLATYGGLVGCAVYWAVHGDLLDFYDAVLWIVCFAAVELNIFSFEQKVEEGLRSSPT